LIHNEAVSRLGAVFNVLKLSVTSPISEEEATEALDTYMMVYILGENPNTMTSATARKLNQAMPEVFLAWKDTQKFVEDVRKKIIKDEVDGTDFASLAKIVETAGEEYGTFQDFECRQMKDTLLKIEYRGTGRVLLSDFYRPALQSDGAWTFQESAGYLRSLGALDESDPLQPSVMMVNYINSPTNCIASSGFYSVCCKNECEGLLGHLEQNIGMPESDPATIAALVANLPSHTQTAPWTLSEGLLQRLANIAMAHGGTVPFHGRLFAQWMHHVYPRECPYPHLSGTINAQLPEHWTEASGYDGTATQEEMKQHVERAASITDAPAKDALAVEDLMPWSSEEELIVVRPDVEVTQPRSTMSNALRGMALLAASGSFAYAMIQTLQTTKLSLGAALGNEKYLV